MKKKINKLLNNPSLFFKDMIDNKKKKIFNFKGKNNNSNLSFEIIVIVTDNNLSIDDCLTSIRKQKTNYKIKINLTAIFVGSPADYDELITKNNLINYKLVYTTLTSFSDLSKELDHANTILIWGGDCIQKDFLDETCKTLDKNINTGKITLPLQVKINSTNGLNQRFHPLQKIFDSYNEKTNLKNLIFFDSIYGINLPTNEFIKNACTFEDYDWIYFNGLQLLLSIVGKNNKIVISKNSIYKTQEMQLQHPFKELGWSDLKTFSQPFSNLVSKSEELILSKNGLELAIKRSLLNFTLKYIKKSLSNQSLLDICSPTQELEFKKRLEYLINMIGSETISSFNYSITELLKSGCIKINKGSRFNNTIDFIQYDEDKQLGLFRYYSSDRHSESFYLENNEIIPQLDKTIEHKIFTDTFSFERRIWISLVDNFKNSKITCNIDGKRVKIRDLNRKINDYLEIDKSLENLKKIKPSFNTVSNYKDCWILMDRDNQADDNAEHLYRFINNNRKDIDAYFVIRNDSHDWTRLKSEGFKLLAYGSSEHEIALESCSRVISSHAAQFATDYFKDKRMLWKKFIFLQHGVIHNDQSALFKPDWKRFDIFVTSSPLEYESISGELSSYKFTRKEVKLTGLPRHDALIKSKFEKEKIILVMPTWRPSLLGKVISGTERELIPNFLESDYYKAWFSLLVNNGLRDFAKKTGYRIIFFPHANIQPYLSEISLPGDIEVMSHASGSIQELFLKASIMITDYSSVAFEMAYLGKPVCYYQFDEREFFSKGHYNKGYFDYRNDGFGPVIKDEQDVISFITDTIKNDCAMQTIYLDKSVSFFPFKDGNCCQRVLNEIENLDDIELNSNDSINYLTESAENAFKEGLWYQATIRYEKLLSINTNENRKNHSINNYFISLQNLGYGMKLEILAASNNEYKESFSRELMLRGDIINDLLFDQNKSLDYPDFPLNYKRDFEIYNLLKNNSINEGLFSFNCKLQSEEALNLNNKPKESSNLNELIELDVDNINCIFFKKSHLMLYLLSTQNKHESVIDYYNNLPYRDRAYILNKYLFLLSLKALKKWGKILQNIGDDPVLQGRTGIANFATIYFFAINYAKTIITDIEDYDYILNNSEELDFNKVSDIAKYHLLTNNDFTRAGMLIEKNVKICDSRIFEFYIRALCRENLQTKAYHLLKECEVADLTQNNMILLGDLAMIFEEYQLADNCFAQASLNSLPIVDKILQHKLNTARVWKSNNKKGSEISYLHSPNPN